MQTLILLVLLALTPQWVSVKDGYLLHERYVVREHDGSQLMLGEFYEVEPGDIRAQCDGSMLIYRASSLEDARGFVEKRCTE